MGKPCSIVGMRFGRLLVLRKIKSVPTKGGTYLIYRCLCDCGVRKSIRAKSLQQGHTLSCGCWNDEKRAERFRSHGLSVYNRWCAIKHRCFNTNSWAYQYYGARGITLAPEWVDNFAAFYSYIGYPPSPEHSLDRIDNDGNYEPGNLRWATKKEQAQNRRPMGSCNAKPRRRENQ